jgi:hypothetical protein
MALALPKDMIRYVVNRMHVGDSVKPCLEVRAGRRSRSRSTHRR